LCRVCGPAKKRRKEGCIMRKISLILVVLLMAAPAWADVAITCSNEGNEVTVSYAVTGEPNKVRAFALDIVVDSGATITGVNDDVNPYYTIYPGSIEIAGGEVTNDGNAVADPCDYPSDTQPGVGSSGITVEMGALYSPTGDSSPNSPPNSGDLLVFYVDNECNVTITQNGTRGGVVLTNPSVEIVSFTSPGYHVVLDCFPGSYSTYNDWVALGKPNCWCGIYGTPQWPYQCDGDADNATEGISKYRVYNKDLNQVVACWKKNAADILADPDCACADFDHKSEGISKYRVYNKDLNMIVANWKKKDAALPGDCPRTE